MKYYFTARTTNLTPDTKLRYRQIINLLQKQGHVNVNSVHRDENNNSSDDSATYDFDKHMTALSKSDALICDATAQSSTVGFQIMFALSNKIPCLVLNFDGPLFDSQKNSVIFSESHNGLLKFVPLNHIDELNDVINDFISECINKPFKFNFYIPLNLYNKISNEAKTHHKTKSDIVRQAIDHYLINETTSRENNR